MRLMPLLREQLCERARAGHRPGHHGRPEASSPWRAGLASFVLARLVPLLPLILMLQRSAGDSHAASSVCTGVAFLVIGLIRGRIADEHPLKSGLETLFIGGSAAAVALWWAGCWKAWQHVRWSLPSPAN
jgi:VIT1/CCC1 family predicted Fe2+/Mn2+ transporter